MKAHAIIYAVVTQRCDESWALIFASRKRQKASLSPTNSGDQGARVFFLFMLVTIEEETFDAVVQGGSSRLTLT